MMHLTCQCGVTCGKESLRKKGNPLPPLHGLLFYMDICTGRIVHTCCGALAGTRNRSIRDYKDGGKSEKVTHT